jgi:hypothetical protein
MTRLRVVGTRTGRATGDRLRRGRRGRWRRGAGPARSRRREPACSAVAPTKLQQREQRRALAESTSRVCFGPCSMAMSTSSMSSSRGGGSSTGMASHQAPSSSRCGDLVGLLASCSAVATSLSPRFATKGCVFADDSLW